MSNYFVQYEVQAHNYEAWGKPEWEPAQNHWGRYLDDAVDDALRKNQTGHVGSSPKSNRARNASVVQCTDSFCIPCRVDNELGPTIEAVLARYQPVAL